MTKKELIAAIQQNIDATGFGPIGKIDIEATLDGLAATVGAELGTGGEVTLPGIGKLSVKHTAERPGRNLRTGEPSPFRRAERCTSARSRR